MLRTMRHAFRCLVGPELTRKYEHGLIPRVIAYPANRMERRANYVLNFIFMVLPAIIAFIPTYIYLYSPIDGHYDYEDWITYVVILVLATIACSYLFRTIARADNPFYQEFLNNYHSVTFSNDFPKYLKTIRKYDFDFNKWPVSYSVEPKLSLLRRTEIIQHNPFSSDVNKYLSTFGRISTQMVSFALAHSFAISTLFPGTTLQANLREELNRDRDIYVIQYNGERAKISTADGYTLDVMYIKQSGPSPKSKILVICCDGSSSYYENGIMHTPLMCGYSVIGWNLPGFANSTGQPFPRKIQNSIDAVMKYATEVLGYPINTIVMYGWSLGGYAATWAAIHHPGVKGLILDASFDDLFLVMKRNAEPKYTHVIREVIRCYVNIDIGALIVDYKGPLIIVRHTLDDVNCLESRRLETNRSNSLVIKVITKRHVEFSGVEYVSTLVRNAACEEHIRNIVQNIQVVPEVKRCMYLISKYMKDFKAGHTAPLPDELFDKVMGDLFKQGTKRGGKG